MPKRYYTYRSMRDERRYGPYWYSALWSVLRPFLVALGTLVAVGGILISVWGSLDAAYLAPTEAEETSFTVESGSSLTRVARGLEEAGLIRSATVFKYYCDFSGFSQKIQSGTYTLSGRMSMRDIADQLTRGDGNPLVRNITLIPGWTVEEFADKLAADGVIADKSAFLAKCRSGADFRDYSYVDAVMRLPTVSQRRYVLEGYLSPNTYEIYVTATDDDIIRRLLSQTERTFPADDQERAAEMGYTMDEILTLASLIEKEAGESDFARVSAIFHNRLNAGMELASDVTIHYVTGRRNMSLDETDLAVDSPFNTYTHKGLPPGPICSPSQEAITAALYPDETFLAENYLYFCAREPGSGELHFSRTLQEHEAAVAVYSPLWKRYDEERGL